MSRLLYNEGRVTGLSSYEEYVRQLKSVDPKFEVATEREWLSASLAAGTSLILKVPDSKGVFEGDDEEQEKLKKLPELMLFSIDENGHLIVTYNDYDKAFATYTRNDDDHLIATYTHDPTEITVSRREDDHVVARVPQDPQETSGGAIWTKGEHGMYVYQVPLPVGTHLSAANPVLASFFYGDCQIDGNGWATYVKRYGALIENTKEKSPEDKVTRIDNDSVPLGDFEGDMLFPKDFFDVSGTADYKKAHKAMMEYIKIADGIVIQPGTWYLSNEDMPYKDFEPDLSRPPVLRIMFSEEITSPFYITLTGFSNRSVLRGISKFDFGSVDTETKEDGDFVGPECYPWASKVHFTSSPAIDYLIKTSIRPGSRNIKVETFKDKPIIKITSNNLLNTNVFTHRSNIGTSNTGKDNFGNPKTLWTGRASNDARSWYSDSGDKNIVSQGRDPDIGVSGSEVEVTYDLNNPYDGSTKLGLHIQDHYEDDDKNKIKNGTHGGFYEITIDPYKLMKDLIDEVYARFQYYDKRLEEIEAEIGNEIDARKNGDLWVLGQVNGIDDDNYGSTTLVDMLNKVLALIYDKNGDIGIDVSYDKLDMDHYDQAGGTLYKATLSWKNGKEPSVADGRIPRANFNIYSGDKTGPDATNWLRSRDDNQENDLYAK